MASRRKEAENTRKSISRSLQNSNMSERELLPNVAALQEERMEIETKEDLMFKVFNNPLILDIILGNVVSSGNSSTIKSCRQVSKSWKISISKMHLLLKMPLFTAAFDSLNDLAPERRLYQFLSIMAESGPPLAPFALKLGPAFFIKQNRNDFLRCLFSFGDSIMEIQLTVPIDSTMAFLMPPGLSLPNLKRFDVSYPKHSIGNPQLFNFATIHLVQSILYAAKSLNSWSILKCEQETLPPDSDVLILPSTLTSIGFKAKLLNLDPLMSKPFEKLTHLSIQAKDGSCFHQERINQLLDKLSGSLQSLTLGGSRFVRNQQLMSKLPSATKLVICRPWRMVTLAENYLPKLEKLALLAQSNENLAIVLMEKPLETVKLLVVWCAKNVTPILNAHGEPNLHEKLQTETLSENMLRYIYVSFPNLTRLTITLSGTQVFGLKYIFKEMRDLESLHIVVESRPQNQKLNWDALLIGIPFATLNNLKGRTMENHLLFMEHMVMGMEGDWQSISVRNLKSLKELSILEAHPDRSEPGSRDLTTNVSCNMLSDIAYNLGFLRMFRLTRMRVTPNFRPSPAASQRWVEAKLFLDEKASIEVVPQPILGLDFFENADWMYE